MAKKTDSKIPIETAPEPVAPAELAPLDPNVLIDILKGIKERIQASEGYAISIVITAPIEGAQRTLSMSAGDGKLYEDMFYNLYLTNPAQRSVTLKILDAVTRDPRRKK